MVLFVGILNFTGTLTGTNTITLHIHKNSSATPDYSITLIAGQTRKIEDRLSLDFTAGDLYHAELVTVGNPNTGTITATLGFY